MVWNAVEGAKPDVPLWHFAEPSGDRKSARLAARRKAHPSIIKVAKTKEGAHEMEKSVSMTETEEPGPLMETEPLAEEPLIETPERATKVIVEPAKLLTAKKVSIDSKQIMSEVLMGNSPIVMPRTPRLARRAMKDLFNTFTDADTISRSGFKEALRSAGRRPKANIVNAVFRSLDVDGNGQIEFDEFANGLSQLSQC